MRLIDADAFIEEARKRIDMQDMYLPVHIKELVLDEMPTVDAVRVKHGRWVWNDYGGLGNYHCSECGKIYICNGDYDYCPNCGARMKDE